MQITEVSPHHSEIINLIQMHKAFCDEVSPPTACFAVTESTPDLEYFRYWLAADGERTLGCIALKTISPGHGEVKTMHVVQTARGSGAGAALVQTLIREAKEAGLKRLSLETGTTDDFAASRRLYERHGFAPCAPFADYNAHPFSHFMTLAI